ncbi:MAG: 30S ribosomal protein S8e [Candidatus Aenigmarchaeota archaeon]|nr:30S ribosomal protein S8e [Candidatus Aenigmarchaeota archaeon]
MTVWHIERGKKITGGIIHVNRKKRRFEKGSSPLLTTLDKEKVKYNRLLANQIKKRLVSSEFVNAMNSHTKKAKKTKILAIVEHADNQHYTRRGIITKGCLVKTESGLVRITSRPSQHGILNGVIVEEKSK